MTQPTFPGHIKCVWSSEADSPEEAESCQVIFGVLVEGCPSKSDVGPPGATCTGEVEGPSNTKARQCGVGGKH